MLKNSEKKWPILDFWYLILVFLFAWICFIAFFYERLGLLAMLLAVFVPIAAGSTGARGLARDNITAYDMAKMNMVIKLNYIPVYVISIMIVISNVIHVNNAGARILILFFMGILIVLFNMFCSVSTGLWGIFSIKKIAREQQMGKGVMAVYTVSQFVCYLDVVIAVILFVKTAKNKNVSQ